MPRVHHAACSSCGIRYPLERKWSDDYGGGFTTLGAFELGAPCAREGCAGRIGFPAHLSERFDALRELWGKREKSLRQQSDRASSQLAVGLHAHTKGMADGMKLAAVELEREQWGRVRELAPVEVFPFVDLEIDRRAAELRAAALKVVHLLKCKNVPTDDDLPRAACDCDRCRFARVLFGDR